MHSTFPSNLDVSSLSAQLKKDGYLVLEKVLSQDTIDALMNQAATLVESFDAESHRSIFSTKDQSDNTNDYHLNSASNISFFFEEDAFDENGKLRQAKSLSINKIGHALHDVDEVFSNFCRSDLIKKTVQEIIGISSPSFVQSMYIYKQPRIGGDVTIHQDNWFIHTTPLTCYGLWFSLEEATTENGCLYVIPGSHKEHPCQKRFQRTGNTVAFDVPAMEHPPKDEEFIAVPVPAGTMVLLDGGLLHRSFPNTSPKSRQAFTVHVVDSEAEYSSDNWLQRPDMPFVGFENPYLTK